MLVILLNGNILATAQGQAKQIIIKGTIVNDEGEKLSGVTVKIKNTTKATVSDANGQYSISVSGTNDVLVFSDVEYGTIERNVASNQRLDVIMFRKTRDLSEVVVIGYGTTTKDDLTGSVGQVKMDDFEKAPVKSFDEALAGRVAGVQVTSSDGQPGATSNIVIRGGNSITQDNSPLYVVDGFPMEDFNLNAINPADIESINILKDASSTAIYGARGANGVILIATKQGQVGPSKIVYSGYGGIQTNTSMVKVLDPYEFVKLQLEIDPVQARDLYLTPLNKTLEDYRNEKGIDWQERLFRTAPMQSHNLSISGGSKDTKYTLSGSIFQQDGIIISSGYNRYQAKFSLNQTIKKNLTLGIRADYSNELTAGTPVGGGTNAYYSLLVNTWQYRPINGTGDLDDLLFLPEDFDVVSATINRFNPVLSAENELRDRKNRQIRANAFGEYTINSNWRVKIYGGYNSYLQRYDVFNNTQTRSGRDVGTGISQVNGSVNFSTIDNYVNENTISYKKAFNKNNRLDAVAGVTFQGRRVSTFGGRALNVPDENLGISGIDQGIANTINSLNSRSNLASFLGRVNYQLYSKYLFTATFRADGSSKFPTSNKWGFFPSGAFAWRMHQEKFLKDLKFISEAKLRASYGIIGNNRVGDYDYFNQLVRGGSSYYFGDEFINGAYVLALGNPQLKWESTSELDLGLDIGLFNQRIQLTADVYKKRTKDLLLNADLPSTSGYLSAFQNIGSVENKGVEFSVNTSNIKSKLEWNSSFNISFNRTKLIALTDNQERLLSTKVWNVATSVANTPVTIARLNNPVAMFYGYIWEGNYQYSDFDETTPGVYTLKSGIPTNGNTTVQPGDIKFRDINGDGKVNADDRTIIGNPNPKFIGGFSNNFSYKGFDLNVFLQFVYGNDIQNINRLIMEGGVGGATNIIGSNQFESFLDRWTPENPTNENIRAGSIPPSVYSSRTIEDGSFLRLKTVSLGYNINSKFLNKYKVSSCKLYMSAQNLLTWTKYTGSDPEVSVYNSALTPGLDYSAYPQAKVVTVGVNLTF